jgi:hypothetical protein
VQDLPEAPSKEFFKQGLLPIFLLCGRRRDHVFVANCFYRLSKIGRGRSREARHWFAIRAGCFLDQPNILKPPVQLTGKVRKCLQHGKAAMTRSSGSGISSRERIAYASAVTVTQKCDRASKRRKVMRLAIWDSASSVQAVRPRSARTIQISKHAPMNPAIR